MSSNIPGSGEPEYLGTAPQRPDTADRGKRTAVLAVVAVAVVAVVGAGGWAALQLMSGGTSAATAVPSNAVGYVSLDLDPSAGQKIEAIKIMKKFPGLDKQLDLGSKDDLRRWVFDKIQEDGSCDKVDYSKDIEPWIGDRVALAAVPSGTDSVTPLVAVQVTDEDAARKGVEVLDGACPGAKDSSGTAFVGDYLVVSDTQKHADALASQAKESSLEDDADFQGWMDKAGDSGVVTMYAAPEALSVISKMEKNRPRMGKLANDFRGGAGVVRFHDGGVEAEFVGGGLPKSLAPKTGAAGADTATLPATTGAALSLAFRRGAVEDSMQSMADMLGTSVADLKAEAEAQTGLELPEDAQTLLGDGVSLSVDSSADLKPLMSGSDPSSLPFGLRIKGDPAAITAVVDKLKSAVGPEADSLVTKSGDGVVALGLNQDYVDKLSAGGKLGDERSFQSVVPEADKASAVFYVNFDAGNGWAGRLAGQLSDGDPSVTENVAPLDALGFSAWADSDGVQHALLRLTTD
jgi:hypothetical protein